MLQCIVRGARLEHEEEHGLQQGEDNGEALPHAVCKDAAKIRALARAKMAAASLQQRHRLAGQRCESRMCPRKPRWARRVAGKGPELVYGVRVIVGAAQVGLV